MTVSILQAVERSIDCDNSVRVANRWPSEVADLSDAMAFIDQTPDFAGWGKVDRFGILASQSRLVASKSFGSSDWVLPEEKSI